VEAEKGEIRRGKGPFFPKNSKLVITQVTGHWSWVLLKREKRKGKKRETRVKLLGESKCKVAGDTAVALQKKIEGRKKGKPVRGGKRDDRRGGRGHRKRRKENEALKYLP